MDRRRRDGHAIDCFNLIPRGHDVIDTKQSGHTRSGPAIFMPEVGWIMLPDALVQASTAGVTALIHEVRNFGAYWALEVEGRTGKRVRLTEFIERHPDSLPPDVREALVKWATFRLQRESSNISYDEEISFRESEVFPLLDRERERQIAGMEAAMCRFLDAISG